MTIEKQRQYLEATLRELRKPPAGRLYGGIPESRLIPVIEARIRELRARERRGSQ